MAILGSDTFDVNEVDLTSVQLEGVTPLRSNIEDVATPFEGKLSDCTSCTTDGPDGFDDVTLKFKNAEILAALGDIQDDECKELTLTGSLLDGTPFEGKDKVKIVPKSKPTPPTTTTEATTPTTEGAITTEAPPATTTEAPKTCEHYDNRGQCEKAYCHWDKKAHPKCSDGESHQALSNIEAADAKAEQPSTSYATSMVSTWAIVPMLVLLSQMFL